MAGNAGEKRRKTCGDRSRLVIFSLAEKGVRLLAQANHKAYFVYLCPRFNEFQKVRPGFVDLIFPLGDGGRVSVTGANKLITHSIRGCHLFRSSIGGISCEIAEFLNEQLWKS